MHKVICIGLLAGLAGCASSHDLSSGSNMLGGGYKQEELGPGLFSIYARSNHAPWANYEAARVTWRNGAEKACGSGAYDELAINESERDTGLQTSTGVRYMVTERTGYAQCDSSTLSESEVQQRVNKDSLIR
ncbi:hypothetical protein [Limnobacter parvus]|uniref:Lipoprotein n=1 Tax=Limnobacter parvus TaxID=2939690 RepID=A0ABT1XGV5_9BURK|nr:hypothetical protein [Limnobacter parvus]MCR2746502.1 hypothetical protein [Limnobacter parvus]